MISAADPVNTKVTSPEAACEVNEGNNLDSNTEPEDTTNDLTAFPSKLSEIEDEVNVIVLISLAAAEADNSLVKFVFAHDPEATVTELIEAENWLVE